MDSMGMKYTNSILGLVTVFLATVLCAGQSRAQSAYMSGAPSLSAYNSANDATVATDWRVMPYF